MRYYKLSPDMEREGDIILHVKNNCDFGRNAFLNGKRIERVEVVPEFIYKEDEGTIWTDLLVNDKGWFLVSEKLRDLLEQVNTDIQYVDVRISCRGEVEENRKYYVANICKVVDALCLELSKYQSVYVEGKGDIYLVSKYGIYENKTDMADVFKLDRWQQIPIFVSDSFKTKVEEEGLTGMHFVEVAVG